MTTAKISEIAAAASAAATDLHEIETVGGVSKKETNAQILDYVAGANSAIARLIDCGTVAVADLLDGPVTLRTPASGELVEGRLFKVAFTDSAGWAIIVQEVDLDGFIPDAICSLTSSTANTSSTQIISDGTAIVAYLATGLNDWRITDTLVAWQANHAYTLTAAITGDMIIDENDNVWSVSTAGTSGSTPPDFASEEGNQGATLADDTAVWTNEGPIATTGTAHVYLLVALP